MALSWDEVAASDGYQSLPPDQKDVARHQYFNDVIAPKAPPEDLHNTWQQFADYSRPSIAADMAKSFGRGVVSGAENTPTMGADVGNTIALGEKKAYEYYRDMSGDPLTRTQENSIENNQPFYTSSQIQDAGHIPRITAQPSTGAGEVSDFAGNVVGGALAMNPNAVRSGISAITRPAADSFAASKAANQFASAAKDTAPFLGQKANNINYAEGLNANAENLKNTYSSIYDKAGEISQGITRNEPGIQSSVSSLLENLKDDPAHQGAAGTSQAYRDLESVKNSFDEDGNIPLDSITLLQRRVNDLYSPDMAGGRKLIYNALNKQLKEATQRAMQDNPEWATIQGSANKLFANYKDTFVNDAKTDPIWSLEDKAEYEKANATNADPYGAGIDTETRDKLYNLPANVKNLAQYEAMLRKLPPELHDQFTQDVVAANSEKAPSLAAKVYTAYKAAQGSPLGVAKGLYKMVANKAGSGINPALADSAPHINDAMDFYGKLSDEAYKFYNQRGGDSNFSALGQKALPAPPDFYVNKVGTAQAPAMNNYSGPISEGKSPVAGIGAPDSQGVDVRGAQMRGGSELGQFAAQNGGQPIKSFEKAGSMSEVGSNIHDPEYEAMETLKNLARARGGKIPSEAQKHAGNYSKDHIKFHGLDIAIETPKGEIRSGKSKDGKNWEVKMPASYGYLKRTVASDGENVDCYVGPHEKSNRVYIIDQHHLHNKAYDEAKVMLGFSGKNEALSTYKSGFSDGKGAQRIGHVAYMDMADFKDWLKNGNTKKPVVKQVA